MEPAPDLSEGTTDEAVPAQHLPARRRAPAGAGPGKDHERRPRRAARDGGRRSVGLLRGAARAEYRDSSTGQERRDAHDRRTVHGRQGTHRRIQRDQGARSGRGDRLGPQACAGYDTADRGSAFSGRSLKPGMAEVSTSEIERVFRQEYGRAVAVLVRSFGDIDLAEEAVQDAFTKAVQRWPEEGVPRSPAEWIITTAKNRAVDHLRREAGRDAKQAEPARP